MLFGQLVIGPPGSGKTTYCDAMSQFLQSMGRKVAIINIDPANDVLPYKPAVDISELITVHDAMNYCSLGPNGGLIYCMEYLEKNFDWLLNEVNKLSDHYLLFDCPGQVELYTHHNSVKNIAAKLLKADLRLVAMHLVDSHYCSDPAKFVAVLLTSLSTMLQVELPHINVLSKGDIIEQYGKLHYNIDYYTEVLDLSYLLDKLTDHPFLKKFKKLNEALVGVIEDYSLVSFIPLNIKEKQSMMRLLQAADKANGYVFGQSEERNIQKLLSCAMGADLDYSKLSVIPEADKNQMDTL
ncbi:GPN-loop GTPase 2-like [Centruroides sculpturatus]|uniref:GPN-loop GTPase 2-like n=1 Tax=Centruroides sculpturatus TaxID=218467 RepID=UPI000C6D07D0|nr:GPN-loop GTPase 2-like [Centruroides sculpturatus]